MQSIDVSNSDVNWSHDQDRHMCGLGLMGSIETVRDYLQHCCVIVHFMIV